MRRPKLVVGVAVGIVVAIVLVVVFVIGFARKYTVPSASMAPTLPANSTISVKTEPLELGKIVVFHPPAGYALASMCGHQNQGVSPDFRTTKAQPCDAPRGGEIRSATFVKRIVGLPGDRLQITDGHVDRNGHEEREPYILACGQQPGCTFTAPITVPSGEYYLMGDNRGDSDDSRFFGPVPKTWITGVVVGCSHSTPYCTGG